MLRSGKHWVENLELTEKLWASIMQETLSGIRVLLDSSEKLLDYGGNEAICAGLYTYAVEEYGKLLLLSKYVPIDGKVKIRYRNIFRKHDKKFETAIQNLPEECINLCRLGFEKGFEESFEHHDIIADFEARTAIFYSDFIESKESDIKIKPVPPVDKNKLKNAIKVLRSIAEIPSL
jgi:AbiV family abortive infection protein